MKLFKNSLKLILLVVAMVSLTIFTSCGDDDKPTPGPQPTGDQVLFALGAVGSSGSSGSATFSKLDDNSVMIAISLSGTSTGGDHPSHIHMNTAAEGGGIVLDLTNVDGETGKSETVVTSLNDGTAITYEELIAYDGYINVHSSASDLGTLVAQGDIGQNALTGEPPRQATRHDRSMACQHYRR